MEFRQGQTVIHPHHGPATVTGHMTRTVRGEIVEYAELTTDAGMKVAVPIARAEEIGIREVANSNELDRLISVLCAETTYDEPRWSRRFKANKESINSGDPLQIAAVVRDLTRRRERQGISQGEKEMLNQASAPLIAEICLAVEVDEDDARSVMQQMILEGSSAALETVGQRRASVA